MPALQESNIEQTRDDRTKPADRGDDRAHSVSKLRV